MTNTDKYIDDICATLKTKRAEGFSNMMKREKLPRAYNMNNYFTLKDFLKKYKKDNISKEYINMLLELDLMYKNYIK